MQAAKLSAPSALRKIRHQVSDLVRQFDQLGEEDLAALSPEVERLYAALRYAPVGERGSEQNQVIRSIPGGLVLFDKNGDITWVNEEGRRYLDDPLFQTNLPYEERVQQAGALFANGRPVTTELSPTYRALRGETVKDCEIISVSRSGEIFDVIINSAPVRNADGEITGAVATFHDNTARKKAEEMLGFQARVLSMLEDAIIATDEQTRIIYWNRAAEKLYGYTAAEVTGHPLFQVLQVQLNEQERGELLRQLTSSGSLEKELLQLTKDGRRLWIECKMITVVDDSGKITGYITDNRDETDHRHAEALSGALNEINQVIHSTLNFDALMQNAVSAAAKALNSDTAALSLRGENSWTIRYVCGFPEDVVGTEMNDEQEPHALTAIRTQKPVAVPDAYADDRVNQAHMRRWGIRSVLVVPVLLREEAIGVMFFNYQKQMHEFKAYHLDFATKLAASISLALDNARLFRDLGNEIIEHEDAEAALRQSEERFHTSVESLVEGFALLSAVRVSENGEPTEGAGKIIDLRYEYINESGCQMNHMTRDQVIGHTVLELLPNHTETGLFERYAQVIETGYPLVERALEYEDVYGNQQRLRRAFDIHAVKFGDGLVITWDDVSDRLRAELEHREALTQVEIHHRLIEQREKERQSIARDIHDGPVQTLSSIGFNLQFVKEVYPDPALRLELDQIGLGVKGAVQELRSIINELRPPALIRFGLKKAIMVHAAELPDKAPQIKWNLNLTDDGILLPEHIHLTLFRVYQEAVNNVIRHSQATKAWISYRQKKDLAILEIRDNGVGLPEDYEVVSFTQNSHYGLAGIAERVEAVGGELIINTTPGQGTSLEIKVPIFQKKLL